MTLAEMARLMPWVRWSEPVKITIPGGGGWRYACRICLAADADKGQGVTPEKLAELPTDPETIREHIAKEHG